MIMKFFFHQKIKFKEKILLKFNQFIKLQKIRILCLLKTKTITKLNMNKFNRKKIIMMILIYFKNKKLYKINKISKKTKKMKSKIMKNN